MGVWGCCTPRPSQFLCPVQMASPALAIALQLSARLVPEAEIVATPEHLLAFSSLGVFVVHEVKEPSAAGP